VLRGCNVARKDLTGYETSRNWKELEKLRREPEKESRNAMPSNGEHPGTKFQGRAPGKMLDSISSRGARMGVSRPTVRKHDATVAYADKYTFMQRGGRWSAPDALQHGGAGMCDVEVEQRADERE
jgi:hypothetical protein